MNLYIKNCSNTFNYGSMMMGENFIRYFNELKCGGHKYYVELEDSEDLERLRNATSVEEIYGVKVNALFSKDMRRADFVLAGLKIKKLASEFLNNIDLIVVLGGDDFYSDNGWKDLMVLRLLADEGHRVVLFGQTMGPYETFRKHFIKYALKKLEVYARDPLTYDYLRRMKLDRVKLMDDLALLPLGKQRELDAEKKYIIFCPSELIARHTMEGTRTDWIDFNFFMLRTLLDRFPDKKIVLLAHVLRPELSDDRRMVRELYGLFDDEERGRIVLEDREIYPYQVREYMQGGCFVVSSRMHPVISGLQCELPAVAFAYSSKYHGIIGQRYGLDDYVLDVRFKGYEELKRDFVDRLNRLQEQYIKIQMRIRKINKETQEIIISAINDL